LQVHRYLQIFTHAVPTYNAMLTMIIDE
jgi:hypothetical protein